jgi:archaellum component FlaC
MNTASKKKLSSMVGKLEKIVADLHEMAEKAQERYDNGSEKFQESEVGEKLREEIDLLTEAADQIENDFCSIADLSMEED